MSETATRPLGTVACACVALGLLVWPTSATPPGVTAREARAAQTDARPAGVLVGSVQETAGQPLGGVQVSAKAAGTTITTTVFTDEQGRYFFPAMRGGPYRVWAQAVGFARAPAEVTIVSGARIHQAFTLHRLGTLDEIAPQLSESEWIAALPDDTREQRRMKEILRVNCGMCHSIAAVLQHRFDERGWLNMIDAMIKFNRPSRRPTVEYHREELAAYLAAVRGPESPPLDVALHPRPTGEAARVVFTQYDIPMKNAPDGLLVLDGNDWSAGRATHHGYLNHDVVIDLDGYAWLTAFPPPDPALYKLDPATGQVSWYAIPNEDGQGMRWTHGIVPHRNGKIYFTALTALGEVDPETHAFEFFDPPPNTGGGVAQDLDTDPQGGVWATTRGGAYRFDPATREWGYFPSPTTPDGGTYGVAADIDGNGWWAQFAGDRVGKGDPRTGRTYEVALRPPWMADTEQTATPQDREFYESIGALTWGGINMVPGAQAPRRMGTDKHGDTLWVANFQGENLARINIRTLDATYYRLPIRSHPYRVTADEDHNAWTSIMGDDWLLRLHPDTAEWTMFQLPVLNCDSRYLWIDHGRDELWVPCARTSQAIRMQFRTAEQLQALANGALPAAPVVPAPAPEPLSTQPVAQPPTGEVAVTRGVFDMRTVALPGPLNERELDGRRLFYGRCSMCHVRPNGPWVDRTTVHALGESHVLELIAAGSERMPGQQYSLTPARMQNVVDYLKTVTPDQKPATLPGWW